jgi:hypothetical protein
VPPGGTKRMAFTTRSCSWLRRAAASPPRSSPPAPPPARAPRRASWPRHLRHLIETLDLLYDAFLSKRLGPGWPEELSRVQKWLQREERGRLAAAG